MHIEETLYVVSLVFSPYKSINHSNIFPFHLPSDFELYDIILPYKRPVLFGLFMLSLLLCIYTRFIRNHVLNNKLVLTIYIASIVMCILYAFFFLIGPIIPSGGMVG